MAAQLVSLSVQDKDVHEINGGIDSPKAGISLEADFASNPFADPEVAAYYAAVYEKAQYECRHVVDPTLEWTRAEERKIVRKLDWHVCLWAVTKDTNVEAQAKADVSTYAVHHVLCAPGRPRQLEPGSL